MQRCHPALSVPWCRLLVSRSLKRCVASGMWVHTALLSWERPQVERGLLVSSPCCVARDCQGPSLASGCPSHNFSAVRPSSQPRLKLQAPSDGNTAEMFFLVINNLSFPPLWWRLFLPATRLLVQELFSGWRVPACFGRGGLRVLRPGRARECERKGSFLSPSCGCKAEAQRGSKPCPKSCRTWSQMSQISARALLSAAFKAHFLHTPPPGQPGCLAIPESICTCILDFAASLKARG